MANIEHVKIKAEEFYWNSNCLQEDLEIAECAINVEEGDTTDEEVEDTDGSITNSSNESDSDN